MQEPDPAVPSALGRADLDAAPISDAERALLRFAETITKHAYKTTDADVEGLRALGWTDPQVAEAVYIAALFTFFNRVADAFGLDDPHDFDHPLPRGGDPIPPGGEA